MDQRPGGVLIVTRRGFLGLTAAAFIPTSAAANNTLYLGTYGDGVGIATYDANGKITATGELTGVPDPSFLIRSGSFLYAVNEQDAGAVTSMAIDAGGNLKLLNRQLNKGSGPCHLAKVGDYLLSANKDPVILPCIRSPPMGAWGNRPIWSGTKVPRRTRTRLMTPDSYDAVGNNDAPLAGGRDQGRRQPGGLSGLHHVYDRALTNAEVQTVYDSGR